MNETIESIQNVRVWRCIASHYRKGHWEFLFDDHVIETHMGEYIAMAGSNGAIKITLHYVGPFKDVFTERERIAPMRGATSLARMRNGLKIEAFQ